MNMNSEQNMISPSCAVCRHLDQQCEGKPGSDMPQVCDRFERYGEFLAKELSFVDRQFVLHQIGGLGLAIGLGFGMTWLISHLG